MAILSIDKGDVRRPLSRTCNAWYPVHDIPDGLGFRVDVLFDRVFTESREFVEGVRSTF